MGAIEAVKAAVVLVVGLTLGWGGANLYASVVSIPVARADGATTEAAKWREKERVAAETNEAARVATQADIAQIERGYLERDATRSAQMAGLEAELAKEKAENDQNPPAVGCACRPAVPRGLRDRLDAIGRRAAEAGDNTAVASPGLR